MHLYDAQDGVRAVQMGDDDREQGGVEQHEYGCRAIDAGEEGEELILEVDALAQLDIITDALGDRRIDEEQARSQQHFEPEGFIGESLPPGGDELYILPVQTHGGGKNREH